MKNQEIVNIFYEIADILEMQNIEWKPQAYRRAARILEAHADDIKKFYKKEGIEGLKELPGIGEGIAKKIVEFIKTGKVKEHEKLLKTIPSHINVLMKIPGMGPKKVKKLNKILNIKTVKELENAALSHKIAHVSGFGEKSEKDILESINLMKGSQERIPLKKAEKIANEIIAKLKKIKEVENITAAGSIRRKKSTIRDIDIIVSSKNPAKVINAFTNIKGIQKVFAKGPRKAIIMIKSIQVDLRVFSPESWGAGLFYFTGNKSYNIEMRKIAIKKGYKLNEYGLFDKKTGKMIAGKTEEEICKKLGVKYLEPEKREI